MTFCVSLHKTKENDNDMKEWMNSVQVVTEESETNRCTPIAVHQIMFGKRSKKKGLSCQVCYFEGRGNIVV